MEFSAADQHRVYLACRPIFAGNNALLRKTKRVRNLISQHKKALRPLIQDFTTERVVNIVKHLLEKEIFQSDVKAKVEFPELFHSSPARTAQRAASEDDAARSAAEALEEMTSRENVLESDDLKPMNTENMDQYITNGPTAAEPPSKTLSLYPMYFPYHVQHVILCKAQTVLEECCFEFIRKWKPSILADGGWECSAAMELTAWTKLLIKYSEKLPQHAFKLDQGSLCETLLATNKLRHTAVHRLPTTCRGVEMLVKSAVSFAETLQDLLRAAQLENLRSDIDSQIIAMELNKNALEDTLIQELQKIERQREELDMREKELAAKIISEDRNNTSLVGDLLEGSVRNLFEETPDDVEQISNDDGEHQDYALAISDSVTGSNLSATEAPTFKNSNEPFNPFKTVKQPVFDISRLCLSDITKAILDRECSQVEASTIEDSDKSYNPFKQHALDISRVGPSEVTKASLDYL